MSQKMKRTNHRIRNPGDLLKEGKCPTKMKIFLIDCLGSAHKAPFPCRSYGYVYT